MRRLAALAAALSLIGGSVAAAEETDAGGLVQEAIDSFNNGAFVRSRELLQQARARARDAKLLGRIHLYLGLNAGVESGAESAKVLFRRALKHDPLLRVDADRVKPDLVRAFEEVRAELRGTLRVTTDRKDVEVWIDGARAGPPPVTREVVAGRHAVELRDAAGKGLLRREVDVQPGHTERLHFAELPPASAPATAPASLPAPESEPVPRIERQRRIWTWIAAAGALTSLAVAIGVGVSARSDHDRACDLLADPGRDCGDRTRLQDPADLGRYEDLHGAVRAKELGANIAWGVAGALAATTAVLYLLEGRSSRVRAAAKRRSMSLELSY